MTLGAYDGKTACCLNLIGQLDVGTTASHVGGDGHCSQSIGALSGKCHDVSLLLVELGVKHLMRNLAHAEHLRQHFRNLNRCGTHEHRAPVVAHQFDFLNHSLVFLACGLIHTVIHILAGYRAVGGNLYNVELVDVPELTCLGRCCTSHTCQLVIHTEVVLQGDGGKSLCCSLHFNVFLSLHSLMQSVAPAAAFHDTSSLLVNNFHLAVNHHILIVLVEHGVCLEQLLQGMYTLALHAVVVEQLILAVHTLLVRKFCVGFKLREL